MKPFILFLSLELLGALVPLQAQDFTYQPQNPAFGGSYLNYGWMLSSAQAQNGYTAAEEDVSSRFERDPLQDFEQSLNRQILSRITREVVGEQFGEAGLAEGQYEIGNYQIDVAPGGEGIDIKILDTVTGSETTVSVPYF